MRRFVCVWFPHWPMERLKRARTTPWPVEDGAPFVLTETGVHGRTLAAVNDAARALGLEPGLRFTDARARVPGLVAEEIDREADALALKRLTLWMTRFFPPHRHGRRRRHPPRRNGLRAPVSAERKPFWCR